MKVKTVLITLCILSLSCSTVTRKNSANNHDKNSEVRLSLSDLKGVWWESRDAPVASFWIKDSTVYFPDQEVEQSEFTYSIIADTIRIIKSDEVLSSKIVKLNSDTLILNTFGIDFIFIRND